MITPWKQRYAATVRAAIAEMRADPLDRRHGTVTGYNYGCRCGRCRAAKHEWYEAEYRERRRRLYEAERRIRDGRHGEAQGR